MNKIYIVDFSICTFDKISLLINQLIVSALNVRFRLQWMWEKILSKKCAIEAVFLSRAEI